MVSSADSPTDASALDLLESHEERTATIRATTAREQFFPLLETVVSDPSEVILIEHKDLPGRGMRRDAEVR